MKIVYRILQKTLVREFYSANTGMFLFLFFILFGIPADPRHFHYTLMTEIIHNPGFLAIVMGFWLLYNLKIINTVANLILHPEQQMLFCINGLPSANIFAAMVFTHVMTWLPVFVYAAVLAVVALQEQQPLIAFYVLLFNLIIIILTALLFQRILDRKPTLPIFTFRLLPAQHFTIPLYLMPLAGLHYSRKQMLLVTKTCSLLVLYGFLRLNQPDANDIRPVQICLLFCAMVHTAIVYQVQRSETTAFAFTRNLPVPEWKRFAWITVTYSLLLLPEIVLLWQGYPVFFHLWDYIHLVFLPVALLGFFHACLYIRPTNPEAFQQIVFAVCMSILLLILYGPGIWLTIALLLLGLLIFIAHCTNYEQVQ